MALIQPSMYSQQPQDKRRRQTQHATRYPSRPWSGGDGTQLPAAVTAQRQHRDNGRRPTSAATIVGNFTQAPPLRPWRCNSNVLHDTREASTTWRQPPQSAVARGDAGSGIKGVGDVGVDVLTHLTHVHDEGHVLERVGPSLAQGKETGVGKVKGKGKAKGKGKVMGRAGSRPPSSGIGSLKYQSFRDWKAQQARQDEEVRP